MDEKALRELKEELQSLKKLFEHTLTQLEENISSDPLSITKYNQVNNVLLDLESDIVNLIMLNGK
jgi:metallo-beta-lactamase family protein